MSQEAFKAETQKIAQETKARFNASEKLVEKYPRVATWLVIGLALVAAFLAVKAYA